VPATFDERVRTLGLAIERDRATVSEHDGFLCVRTPGNPSYYFGNVLIFDRAPQTDDADRWPQHFDEQFAGDPQVRHAAYAWSIDADAGTTQPFLERGYTFEERAVLTADRAAEYEPPPGVRIRPLQSERDWRMQLELGYATREEQHDREPYDAFKRLQVAYHREISRRFGVWLGAFEGDRLTGSCGIFDAGDGIARYQDVGVHEEYRNRGIARSLISAAGRFACEHLGAAQLVIVANADDFARRIYERAGFIAIQREGALWISHR
jgi:ribosomal protein S18 acetylase RimI-like enzyme